MSREQKTEAVILSTSDVFDADRLYLLFTREFGKLRARAKGVRKPTSRLTGHLLQFLPTELALVRQGEFYLIVQASITPNAAYPPDTLQFLGFSEQIAEAVDKLVVDQSPHPSLYDGLVYTLERLQETHTPEIVTAEFLLKCLVTLGYTPELDRSVVGEKNLDPDHLGWSSEIGGVFTIPPMGMPPGALRVASARSIVVLRQLIRPEFVGERLGIPEEVQKEAVRLIQDYIQTIIGKPLRSMQS
jgi:DNA repair protein RecO (recombination protein O)